MPVYPMRCPSCEGKKEFISSPSRYMDEIKGNVTCETCGEALVADFSPEVRNAMAPIVDFKPHYCYALGKRVETKSEMFSEAAKQGVKLNRSY